MAALAWRDSIRRRVLDHLAGCGGALAEPQEVWIRVSGQRDRCQRFDWRVCMPPGLCHLRCSDGHVVTARLRAIRRRKAVFADSRTLTDAELEQAAAQHA
jgi:hypothetical protein